MIPRESEVPLPAGTCHRSYYPRIHPMVTIKAILQDSPHLATVKRLWREQSDTLGFMPQGAFDEHAARRCLLGAFDESDRCVGYLLYRRRGDRIAITHLCVDPSQRGQGVARELVNELSRLEAAYLALELLCRRDFEANKIWPKLGFIASKEQSGRSHDGKLLTHWERHNPHPDLFTVRRESGRVHAVIDANIFFDLVSGAKAPRVDSQALLADWLQGSLTLYITKELFNEIDRNQAGPVDRKRLRLEANRFEQCPTGDWTAVERIYHQLATPLPPKGQRDGSDLRQLAYAIESGIPFFVTQDKRLLDAGDDIYRSHSLTVIRPSDLILQVDALEQEGRYQPRRFSGTTLHIGRIRAGQDDLLVSRLQNSASGESKASFLEQLRKVLAAPDATVCEWVAGPEGEALALTARTATAAGELHVPMLRVAPGPLAPTLARHLLFHCLKQAVKQGCHALWITDRFLDSATRQAIRMDPFMETQEGWLRLCISRTATAVELLQQLGELTSRLDVAPDALRSYISKISPEELSQNPRLAADFERMFWPAKIADAQIPTYIVPIQPHWAQHLFDEQMAAHDLFGARLDLALNREAAYYRADSPPRLVSPARILWYVSKDKKSRFGGTAHLRACSRLEDVVVDTPKALFRRFRRLGVYEWKHVLETARGKLDGKLMALQFCDSEALRSPVAWEQMQAVLKEVGVRTQLQSPTKIPPEAFVRLYNAPHS